MLGFPRFGSRLIPCLRRVLPPVTRLRVPTLLMLMTLVVSGCRNAPVSGRQQFVAIPEQEEIRLGEEAWQTIQAREQPASNEKFTQLVERVGHRIAAVAGRPDYQWEFRLFASEKPNAFALPGGKVAVYEGILPVCENEAGLAVVMSHEIAHVLARHGGERMTHAATARVGGGLLGKAISRQPASQQEKWMQAYGAASQYGVLLPYSRTHESEADSIGLMLMAKAGYDPAEAPRFWQRFSRLSGEKPPEFLSTHPSDDHRAAHLQGLLPQAVAIYKAAPEKLGTGIAFATPANASPDSSGIQLAGHEAPPQGGPVQQAAFTQVDVEEFLPPIERVRSEAPAAASSAIDVTAEAEPAPFPEARPKSVDAGGWAPAVQ